MKYKTYQILLFLLCGLSFSGLTSCVNTQKIKPQTNVNNNIKLIYEFKDIMSTHIAFIPGTNKAVINHSIDAIIVDLEKNNTTIKIPSPDTDGFIKDISTSKHNNRLLISTQMIAQVWDINTSKLLGTFNSKNGSLINGLSADGKLLVFDEHIYNISTKQPVMQFSQDVVPQDYDYSEDGQYFAVGGHTSGTGIIDIKSKQQMDTIFEKGMQNTRFSQNNHLYAGYDSKLLPELGGYYAASIGLYDITNQQRLNEYTPSSRITCWVKLADNRILATLVNGKLELLNHQLDLEKSWQLGDKITTCAASHNNNIWLGSEKTGIYLFKPNSAEISRAIETINDPSQLAVSEDGKYLGVLKGVPDGSHVNIFLIQ